MKKLIAPLLLLIMACGSPVTQTEDDDGSDDIDRYWGPSEVVTYSQAPGYFSTSDTFSIENNLEKILGFPVGNGVYAPDNSSIVTLGEAGGSVTLKFDPPIENIENSSDFIVYGNTFWMGGDSETPNMEPAFIEVMAENDNNWYMLVSDSNLTTLERVEITYSRDDYEESYWPDTAEDNLVMETVASLDDFSETQGFAEVSPTLALPDDMENKDFYTDPDLGGGDPFDIDWAVDDNFNRVILEDITYIRITTAIYADESYSDASSSEIDAVIRVKND